MAEQTIEARITEVVRDAKNPIWVRAKTDHPSVKRIDMNTDDHAREAMALLASGEVAVLRVNHQQKPREGGGVWDNYYWGGVATRAAQPAMPEIPVEAQRPTDKGDAWRICLSLGAKLAVQSLPSILTNPNLREQDVSFGGQSELALAWATFIYTTPAPQPGARPTGQNGSEAPVRTHAGGYSEPDGPPPYQDDDIPF